MNITFNLIIAMALFICITVLILSIVADFLFYSREKNVKREQRSIVATGTMFMFFFIYYGVIRLKLGQVSFQNEFTENVLSAAGVIMVGAGTVINILGRLQLKENWANHIKIYDSHKLIKNGVYNAVRHPLYSSLMIMLLGGVLVYKSYLSFILTAFIFVPFMVYRAYQEEELLIKEFPEYLEYKKSTGMFLPKIHRILL